MTNILTANQQDCGDTLGTAEGWWCSGGEATLTTSTAAYRSSPRSLIMTSTLADTIFVRSDQDGATGFLCPEGSVVNVSGWARRADGTTGGTHLYVVVNWLQSNGTYINFSAGTITPISSTFAQSTLTDAVAPAGTGRCSIHLAIYGSVVVGNQFHWDDISADIASVSNVTYGRLITIGG